MKKVLLVLSLITHVIISCSPDDYNVEIDSTPDSYYKNTKITFFENGVALVVYDYIYDADNEYRIESRVIESEGSDGTPSYSTTSYEYNPSGQIISLTSSSDWSESITNFTYENGLIVESDQHIDNGESIIVEYTYNSSQQLIKRIVNGSCERNFTYDSHNNTISNTTSPTSPCGANTIQEFDNMKNYSTLKYPKALEKISFIGENNRTLQHYDDGRETLIIYYEYNSEGYPIKRSRNTTDGEDTYYVFEYETFEI